MLVAVSILRTELAKHPAIGQQLSQIPIRVVEHQGYCEYYVKDWKMVFRLFNQQQVSFVFTPLATETNGKESP